MSEQTQDRLEEKGRRHGRQEALEEREEKTTKAKAKSWGSEGAQVAAHWTVKQCRAGPHGTGDGQKLRLSQGWPELKERATA